MDGLNNLINPNRAALAQAIQARDEARQRHAEASDAHRRASVAVHDALAVVTRLGDPDAAIAQHRAEAIRCGQPATLPPNLLAARGAKRDADQELSDTSSARDVLAGQRDTVAAELRQAEAVVVNAAQAVLIEEIGTYAAELAQLRNSAFGLKILLLGASQVYVRQPDGGVRPISLPSETVTAITAPAEPWGNVIRGQGGPEAGAAAHWTAYLGRLTLDADARLQA